MSRDPLVDVGGLNGLLADEVESYGRAIAERDLARDAAVCLEQELAAAEAELGKANEDRDTFIRSAVRLGAIVDEFADAVFGVAQGHLLEPDEVLAEVKHLVRARDDARSAGEAYRRRAVTAEAVVAQVRDIAESVLSLQPADPDTGDRDVSFFALCEALDGDS